jgi:hypothetical protein
MGKTTVLMMRRRFLLADTGTFRIAKVRRHLRVGKYSFLRLGKD